jgi:hypothetical protein
MRERGIRNVVKTKEGTREGKRGVAEGSELLQRYPHPGRFCKRACKLLKTNEASAKNSGKVKKRLQKCENTGVARKAGIARRKERRNGARARIEREEKSIDGVGRCIVVGAGLALVEITLLVFAVRLGGRVFLALCRLTSASP